jgi:hypothetical protein
MNEAYDRSIHPSCAPQHTLVLRNERVADSKFYRAYHVEETDSYCRSADMLSALDGTLISAVAVVGGRNN